ncbi:MAG: class II fructose-bisphosphate aldolase [Candidatus Hydrogenedentes bacterium]|nr:class II fructose-bisphosphate aldolase [Candidatus Hydrogenedentota bacterium]
MPLVVDRNAVCDTYAWAAEQRWVMPGFGTESQTTTEALLAAALEHANRIGVPNMPVIVSVTNLYTGRTQTVNYTRTKRWDIGLRMFMSNLEVLTAPGSPFEKLRVMAHLDHIQHDIDEELLAWDMRQFSSIMYDASELPFEQNMEATARFVDAHKHEIFIEGACDEIAEATGDQRNDLTTPERAAEYFQRTGADIIVANLGTEHRASASTLQYHGEMARQVRDLVGTRMCLHGVSSVPPEQIEHLFDDGVCKANIWTMLERDSTPVLFRDMAQHAAKVAGPKVAKELAEQGILGPKADVTSASSLQYFTHVHRETIAFDEIKRLAGQFFALWYRRDEA